MIKNKTITTDKAVLLVVEIPSEILKKAKHIFEGQEISVSRTRKHIQAHCANKNVDIDFKFVDFIKKSGLFECTGGSFEVPERTYTINSELKLLGRLPDITEEQSIEVVDSYEVSHNLDLTTTLAFKDYNNGISEDENVDYDYWDEYPFDTAIQSFSSLLQSNDIYFENHLGDEPKYSHYNYGNAYPSPSERKRFERDLKDWQEAQSKVWDKERTYLFIKVD